MIYQTATFSTTLNDLITPISRSRHYLMVISQKRYEIYSFNGIAGTYTCPTQGCHFERPWVILSDLAKYSITRSIERSLRQLSLLCHPVTACGLLLSSFTVGKTV